jgi:hypothetical protein
MPAHDNPLAKLVVPLFLDTKLLMLCQQVLASGHCYLPSCWSRSVVTEG